MTTVRRTELVWHAGKTGLGYGCVGLSRVSLLVSQAGWLLAP